MIVNPVKNEPIIIQLKLLGLNKNYSYTGRPYPY